jgi:hypothetical protein
VQPANGIRARASDQGVRSIALAWTLSATTAAAAFAATAQPGPTLTIRRTVGEIAIDGDLGDPGWADATPITEWYETNISASEPSKIANVGRLAYDDKFFYAGFEFEDPDPKAIRAPVSDRDNVGSPTDYAGVIVDSQGTWKSAILFLANPRGIQYDAVTNDASGEDSSPDFYWEAVGKITAKGWNLELRIPFSSLRYSSADPQTWGILLYRNYPRDRRYQMFSTKLPRDVNCFICNSNRLEGLAGLPSGQHWVAAPYVNLAGAQTPSGGPGTSFDQDDEDFDGGLDVKWIPNAATAIDATINPDFSQIESDTALVSANERFALFFPEKRPFFLEGIDLFATPIQAVYTRTITAPRWGARATGELAGTVYTALVAEDRGGGSVIIPGPQGSGLADQDFESRVGLARVRRDLGNSFVSFLGTVREIGPSGGGGSNQVFGPDFQWRPTGSDAITGQILFSRSTTPDRPGLAGEWDGRDLDSHAAVVWWSHSTATWDWYAEGRDFGDEFRADVGFVPQAGYRQGYVDIGRSWRPKDRFLNRFRLFTYEDYSTDRDGSILQRIRSGGFEASGPKASFLRMRFTFDDVRVGDRLLSKFQPRAQFEFTPSARFNRFYFLGFIGEEIDFANGREGEGGEVNLQMTFRPTDHLELRWTSQSRWLDVEDEASGRKGRLFTADVARLRTTYNFNSRMFLRAITQYVETDRDPALYTFPVSEKDAGLESSLLFSYKLNWQSVLFVGFGDSRTFLERTDGLEKAGRQVFVKLSYAFQR